MLYGCEGKFFGKDSFLGKKSKFILTALSVGLVLASAASVRCQETQITTVTSSSTTDNMYAPILEGRCEDFRIVLSDDLAKNLITTNQYADLKQQLGDIVNLEAQAKLSDNGLSLAEAVDLGRRLDAFNATLAAFANVRVLTPLVVLDSSGAPTISTTTRRVVTSNADGSRTVVTTTTKNVDNNPAVRTTVVPGTATTIVSISDPVMVLSLLDSRRFEIDRIISDNLVRGKISAGQALQLQQQLDSIASQISDARLARLSPSDSRVISIATQLDSVSNGLVTLVNVPPLSPVTVLDTTTGSTRITLDAFGNVISVKSVQPSLLLATVDARIQDLQKLIASGEASGQLNSQQAAGFRTELDYLTNLTNGLKLSGTATYSNVLPIALQLDTLSNRMKITVANATIQPLVVGSRLILSSNQVVLLDDVMVRRAGLEGRIADELASRKISPTQASSLRSQLDQIATVESQMRADGNLDFKESRQLYKDFDKVGSRLDGYIAKD